MATHRLPPLGRGVQHTGGGNADPVPTFRVQSMRVPKAFQLDPGAAGQFESTINKHRISPMAAEELATQHFAHVQKLHDAAERARSDYYHAERVRYRAQPGSADKIKAAQGLLHAYARAHGRDAHDAAKAALERDAGHIGATVDLLSWAAGHHAGGSKSKAARRYASPVHAMARMIEVIKIWLGGHEPAFAHRESANG